MKLQMLLYYDMVFFIRKNSIRNPLELQKNFSEIQRNISPGMLFICLAYFNVGVEISSFKLTTLPLEHKLDQEHIK